MTGQKQNIEKQIVEATRRLLSDGKPRLAREIASELLRFDVDVDKALVNRVLYHQGKPFIQYDRSSYQYYLAQSVAAPSAYADLIPKGDATTPHAKAPTLDLKPPTPDSLNQIPRSEAKGHIENLCMGIPPRHNIQHFTVGRRSEIEDLVSLLNTPSRRIKLLKANYGSGKTHLLRLLREVALQQNFAVSFITLDAKSGVRFNRLEEIFGTIVRNLECSSWKGIEGLFSTFIKRKILSGKSYITSNKLQSPALQHALEWWAYSERHNGRTTRDAIVEWLKHPSHFTTSSQQAHLYGKIIGKTYLNSQDRKKLGQLRHAGVFKWTDPSDYARTWTALAELHELTKLAGQNGLVILIDEFEDVISNMTRAQQIRAFEHLFDFYRGRYPGLAVFAITPQFVENCRAVIQKKSIVKFDVQSFERLPFLEFSSLSEKDLFDYAHKIVDLYEYAYQHRFQDKKAILSQLEHECKVASRRADLVRPRFIAKRTTDILNDYLD
jgi:hypothetical protein